MKTLIERIEAELEAAEEAAKEAAEEKACDYVRGSCNGAIHGLKMALIHARHVATIERLESQRLKEFHNI